MKEGDVLRCKKTYTFRDDTYFFENNYYTITREVPYSDHYYNHSHDRFKLNYDGIHSVDIYMYRREMEEFFDTRTFKFGR